MPELPEVETMCRGIAGIVGSRIVRVERARCRRRPIAITPRLDRFRRRAEGKTIAAIGRAGKRIVIWLVQTEQGGTISSAPTCEEAIVIEPRMTGLVLLADPPSREHLRFRMELGGGSVRELWFWDRRGLGTVRLLSADEFVSSYNGAGSKLGPDALSVTADQLRERFHRSRRAIKVALLDQKAMAGIGNLYASEMLHVARIHPAAHCHRLTIEQWRRLHAAMREVLEAAVRHEGSTLTDGTYRNALNQSGGYQYHHRVYDREGEPCPACGGIIRRVVQAQRSTFFCPHCQRR